MRSIWSFRIIRFQGLNLSKIPPPATSATRISLSCPSLAKLMFQEVVRDERCTTRSGGWSS